MRPFLLCASCLLLSGILQADSEVGTRISAAEQVLDRFYRGEPLDLLRQRMNAEVDAFNAQLKARQAEVEKARLQAEQDLKPVQERLGQVAEMDRELESAGQPAGKEAVERHNTMVEQRNRLAEEAAELNDAARKSAEAYNALVQRVQVETDRERARMKSAHAEARLRLDAYDAFRAKGDDAKFFRGLNGLLADLNTGFRGGRTELKAPLEKVRGFRRELARWAQGQQARQEHGLVLVEAQIGEEPCCFMVDTGAQLICLSAELIEALGLSGSLGEEKTLILAGGQRIQGRGLDLPSITVAGVTETKVAASAVPASDVGIDGLLGQSFLKRFVYTIDERKPEKLILVRK